MESDALMFGPGGPNQATFLREYWRKKPLLVKDGQRYFANVAMDTARFDAIAQTMRATAPRDVKESGDGVVFVQNMDQVDPRLAALSEGFAEQFGWRRCWFDGVSATAASAGGIGSHYDDSDNFVLQQSGIKLWRLCPPGRAMEDEQRLRLIGEPRVGNAVMDDNALLFRLEPGDVLYMPMLWPHWGSTQGDSLSVSLVCNSANMMRTVLPLMSRKLGHAEAWWEPLPSQCDPGAWFDRAMQCLRDDRFIEILRREWLASFEGRNPVTVQRFSGNASAWVLPKPPAPDDAQVDAALRGSTVETHGEALALHELTHVIATLCMLLPQQDARQQKLQTLLEALHATRPVHTEIFPPSDELPFPRTREPMRPLSRTSGYSGSPQLRLWTWRVRQALAFSHHARIDQLLTYLPGLIERDGTWPTQALLSGSRLYLSDSDDFLTTFLPLASSANAPALTLTDCRAGIEHLASAWPSLAGALLERAHLLVPHPSLATAPDRVDLYTRAGIVAVFADDLTDPVRLAWRSALQFAHAWAAALRRDELTEPLTAAFAAQARIRLGLSAAAPDLNQCAPRWRPLLAAVASGAIDPLTNKQHDT